MSDREPGVQLDPATIAATAATTATVAGPGVCSCCLRRMPSPDPAGPGLGLGAIWLCGTCLDAIAGLLAHRPSGQISDPETYFKSLAAPDPAGQG
jgi:hypothetical protein